MLSALRLLIWPPLTVKLSLEKSGALSLRVAVKVVLCPAPSVALPVLAKVTVGRTVSTTTTALLAALVLPALSVWLTLMVSSPCPMAVRSPATRV